MGQTVVIESPQPQTVRAIKGDIKGLSVIQDTRVPQAIRASGGPGSGRMKTIVPDPVDGVAQLNGHILRCEFQPTQPHMDRDGGGIGLQGGSDAEHREKRSTTEDRKPMRGARDGEARVSGWQHGENCVYRNVPSQPASSQSSRLFRQNSRAPPAATVKIGTGWPHDMSMLFDATAAPAPRASSPQGGLPPSTST